MVALAVLTLAACAPRRPLHVLPLTLPQPDTWITNVRVFDADTMALSSPADVQLHGSQIAAIVPTGEARSGVVVDGTGCTLLPGLIDSHVHLGGGNGQAPWRFELPDSRGQLEALLLSGVTTVLSAVDQDTAALVKKLQRGVLRGPRILRASRAFTRRGGHPEPLLRALLPRILEGSAIRNARVPIDDVASIDSRMEHEIRRTHPDVVKVMYDDLPDGTPRLDVPMLQALVVAARRHNLKTIVHVGTARDAVEAAEAGAWIIMHTPPEDLLTDEDVAAIKASGTHVVTTVRIYRVLRELGGSDPSWHSLEEEVIPASTLDAFSKRPTDFEPPAFSAAYVERLPALDANSMANVVALYRAGVPQLAGTDSGVPGLFQGPALHDELEALVEAGIPAAEVLVMATSRPADLLVPHAKVGRVAVGHRADLLLVRGDPTLDITATRRIAGVWQAGHRIR